MPKYTVRVYKLGTSPSAPQEFAVDNVLSLADFNKMGAVIAVPTLVYNESAVAVMLVTPTADSAAHQSAPTQIRQKAVDHDDKSA